MALLLLFLHLDLNLTPAEKITSKKQLNNYKQMPKRPQNNFKGEQVDSQNDEKDTK